MNDYATQNKRLIVTLMKVAEPSCIWQWGD